MPERPSPRAANLDQAPSAAEAAITAFASRPRIELALDWDGVLAPFASDPEAAWASPGVIAMIAQLAASPGCGVTVVSGRDPSVVRRLARRDAPEFVDGGDAGSTQGNGDDVPRLRVIGNHGASIDHAFGDATKTGFSPSEHAHRDRLIHEITRGLSSEFGDRYPIVERVDPAARDVIRVEEKATGVAIHVRSFADDKQAQEVLDFVRTYCAEHQTPTAPLYRRPGSRVEEITVTHGNKGEALALIGRASKGAPILFMGDDDTDIDAFRVLRPADGDLGVVVGDKITSQLQQDPTIAAHLFVHVASPVQAADLLRLLAERRVSCAT